MEEMVGINLDQERESRRQLLSDRLTKKSFHPFSIILRDGKRIEIVRPLQAAVGLTTFLVGSASLEGNIARQYALDDVGAFEIDGVELR